MARSGFSPAFAMCCLLIACGANVDVVDDDGGGDGSGNSGQGNSGQGNSGQGNSAQGGSGQGAFAQGGSGDGGGISPSGGAGPGSTGTGMMVCDAQGPCGQCVAEACPDVWCSCANNPDCLALYGCNFDCPQGQGNEACIQDCLAAFPDGISDAVLANNCAAGPCEGSCPQVGDPLTPCEECTYSTCPDAMNACLSNVACLDLYACLAERGPNDLSCHQGCYNAHPDGIEDLEGVLDCTSGPCAAPCG